MAKLYVGNLPYSTTDQQLSELFAPYGKVVSATIISDRYSGRSKGFGFVEFETDEEAEKAIQEKNGWKIDDRPIVVSVARPKEDRPARDFSQNRDFRGGMRHTGGRDYQRSDRRGR